MTCFRVEQSLRRLGPNFTRKKDPLRWRRDHHSSNGLASLQVFRNTKAAMFELIRIPPPSMTKERRFEIIGQAQFSIRASFCRHHRWRSIFHLSKYQHTSLPGSIVAAACLSRRHTGRPCDCCVLPPRFSDRAKT